MEYMYLTPQVSFNMNLNIYLLTIQIIIYRLSGTIFTVKNRHVIKAHFMLRGMLLMSAKCLKTRTIIFIDVVNSSIKSLMHT
jgi:hypothetical protein